MIHPILSQLPERNTYEDFSRKNVELRVVPGRGRSAFAARQFKGGDFVNTVVKFKRNKRTIGETAAMLKAKHVFDASGSINDPGRYINHAFKNYNLQKIPK